MAQPEYRQIGERIGLGLWAMVIGLLVGGLGFVAEFVKTLALAASLSGVLAGAALRLDEAKPDSHLAVDARTLTLGQIIISISFGLGIGVWIGQKFT